MLQIIINNSSMIPIYLQVANCIKQQIISKQLKANEALPSVRNLSCQLKISALTVKKSYDYLEQHGYIVTVHGKGSYIADVSQEISQEIKIKEVEDDFAKAIEKANLLHLSKQEIKDIVELLLEQ